MARARTGPLVVEVGTVFSFRTSPACPTSPPDTGRYGAFKVVGRTDDTVALAALEGVWSEQPRLEDVAGASVLRNQRYSFGGRPAIIGVTPDDTPTMDELTVLGVDPLTEEQRRWGARFESEDIVGLSYGTPDNVDVDVEGEWRWEHDRDAYVAEQEAETARREAVRQAEQEYFETRLKGLTWEQLLSETPFSRWDPSPPFPPAEFRDAAAARVHETCRALQAMTPKPRKADARRELRALVEWLNAADDAAGHVIETEEREDISLVLLEIAHVARHRSLVEEADAWRTW